MIVKQLVDALNLTVYAGEAGLNREIKGGYVSDLLSDVMGHAQEGQIWATLQTHKNVMAVASLRDLSAVLLVKGNFPDTDMAEQANLEGIPVIGTNEEMFELTGKLYALLNK
jgi:predicted transcriptional regulator